MIPQKKFCCANAPNNLGMFKYTAEQGSAILVVEGLRAQYFQ